VKFEFIHVHRTQFKISRMCAMLGVSRSGYYDWRDRPESARAVRHRQLTEKIVAIHRSVKEIYGSPRIHGELKEMGDVVGKNTVAMLMRRRRLQSRVHRRFVVTTNSRRSQPAAPNRMSMSQTSFGEVLLTTEGIRQGIVNAGIPRDLGAALASSILGGILGPAPNHKRRYRLRAGGECKFHYQFM